MIDGDLFAEALGQPHDLDGECGFGHGVTGAG